MDYDATCHDLYPEKSNAQLEHLYSVIVGDSSCSFVASNGGHLWETP